MHCRQPPSSASQLCFFFFLFFSWGGGSFRLSLFFLCSLYVCVFVFYFERENHNKYEIFVWLFVVALDQFGWVGFGLALVGCRLPVSCGGCGVVGLC